MVVADAGRATERIARIFDDMEFTTIAVLGGISTVGLALATTTGVAIARALDMDLRCLNAVEALVIAGGAVAYSIGVVRFLPGEFGGPLAVGGVVAVGLAAVAALLAPFGGCETTEPIEGMMESVRLDTHGSGNVFGAFSPASGRSVASNCATCGAPPGQPQALETAPAVQGRGYRGT